VTFNEQLVSLVQAKPLLHNSPLMEYKNDKITDTISETSNILKTDGQMFLCFKKANLRLLLFISLLMFLLWDCVWN